MDVTSTSAQLRFETVLEAARRGEHRALGELFRAYQPSLLRYLRSQEPRVADDLAGEVWVGVARRLHNFAGSESAFRSWLFTIARCRLIEHWRAVTKARTEPVPQELLDIPDSTPDHADPAHLVLAQMSAAEAVEQATTGLTDDQAEVIRLRVLAGLDVGEVARIMQRTPGSVRVICYRALRRLAERLSEEVTIE